MNAFGVKCYSHKKDYFDKIAKPFNYEIHSFPLLFKYSNDQCSRMLRWHHGCKLKDMTNTKNIGSIYKLKFYLLSCSKYYVAGKQYLQATTQFNFSDKI